MRNILAKRPNKTYDLVVRGIPFGGHINGKDSDGEFFHSNTNLSSHPVPILYAHGNQIDTPESKKGQVYGVTEDIWKESDGFYYGVQIFDDAEVEDYNGQKYKAKDYFRDSASMGMLFSSIGSLHGADIDVDKTGAINKVVVAELSLIDKRLTPTVNPKNYYAVAKTKAKANFVKAGIIDENLKIKGICKCGCGLNSESLFDDDTAEKCELCTKDNPCQKCIEKCNQTNNNKKGDGMNLLAKLKALLDGKKDGEDLTAEEVQSILKAGETTTVTTSSDNIAQVVQNAITQATAPIVAQMNEMQKNFNTELVTLKATQEQNSFNKYLGSMLNIKLTADEVSHYQGIFESLTGLDTTAKDGIVTKLKAQIEAKTPLAQLVANGARILDDESDESVAKSNEEYAFVASVAQKAGVDVFGNEQKPTDYLKEIAQKAMEQAGGKK